MKSILFLTLHTLLLAQEFTKSAFPILQMGQSAYSLALGNTGIAGDVNSASFITNPASLMGTSSELISLNMQFLSLDRRVYSFSYYRPLSERVFLSLGWIRSSVNDLYQFSSQAKRGSEIDYGDNVFAISAGLIINKKLTSAFSVKYMLQSITGKNLDRYNASAIAIDLSLFYKWNDALQIGFSAQNLIQRVTTNSGLIFETVHSESLPKIIVVGFKSVPLFKFSRMKNIALLFDYKIIEKQSNTIHLGLDVKVMKRFFFRFGLENTEFRVGFGLESFISNHIFKFDYAYLNSSINAGISHVLSWMINL